MAWNITQKRVHNYGDGLNGGRALPQKIIENVLNTKCPCGRWTMAYCIVDTSDLPVEVTNGQSWACDGCWTSWVRHDPQHQRTYQGRPFRMLDWMELHGAPATNIARQVASDALLHAEMMRKRQEIVSRSQDDSREREPARIGRTQELARIDDNINRMLDRGRSPASLP